MVPTFRINLGLSSKDNTSVTNFMTFYPQMAVILNVIVSYTNGNWGDPDVDGRIILRGIFRKWEGVAGIG